MKLTLKKMIVSILCISMIPSMMTGCKKESTSYSHTDFAMGTVTNITLYGTSDDLEQTEQKIIDMEKKLEKQGIQLDVLAEIVTDSEAMSKLFAEGAAVMIEKKGVSLYQRVYDMVDLCMENEVSILGVIDTRK